ncbi:MULTISPECIES: trypsin-like peptidase domain-containing protein [unclassified Streptomyces]|uniref:trypsin-like serine peptidase n=1 Tax=unclassified Streptomyces TaxID=2593676 RepID=UPI00344E5C08
MPNTPPVPSDSTARPGEPVRRTRSRRRAALAAAATAALLAVTATACGPDTDAAAGAGSSAASDHKGPHLPDGAPTSLDDLKKWQDGGWKNWGQWAHRAKDFINPIIKDHWKPERLAQAKAAPNITVKSSTTDSGYGATDPAPTPVTAQEVSRPYHRNMAPIGKIFMDSPEGSMVCSGTVVEDPAHPGKSNLVWTAGHCVHSGKKGGWMRNIIFVPSYNDNGVPKSQIGHHSSREITPYGKFWADWVNTSQQWIDEGTLTDAVGGTAHDFAVLHVRPENGSGKSLQETVGAAVPIAFDAPTAERIGTIESFGYPAAAPYDGSRMMSCLGPTARLTVQPGTSPLDRIGCTMTAGSSGGGWFANRGGKLTLVTNTSIGNDKQHWLAGPHLGPEAQQVFDSMSRKFAGQR